MFCEKCGKEIPEGSNWCPFCGKKNDAITNKNARVAIALIGAVAAIMFFVGACFGFDKMGYSSYLGYEWSFISILTFVSLGLSLLSVAATIFFYFKMKK